MSSDESDNEVKESDLPSAAVCEERCKRFAEVTSTDTALAMFFLQDRQWKLDSALDAFFAQNPGYGESNQEYPALTLTNENSAAGDSQMGSKEEKDDAVKDHKPHRIRLITWNIDGLDTSNLKQRTMSVIKTIIAEKAEVVFLQEVVGASEKLLRASLPDYQVLSGGTATAEGYYTAVLLHRSHAVLDDYTVTPFTSSTMARSILLVNTTVKGIPLTLMTSHLESTKPHATERKRQLQVALKQMKDSPSDRTVLFGGDLNIRDKEVEDIGGLPKGIADVWEATGSRKEARYTWDTYRNDNLGTEGKWRTRLRFDRLYLRPSHPAPALTPVYLELIGLQRVPDVNRFPSDHWGILAHFDVVDKSETSKFNVKPKAEESTPPPVEVSKE